MATDQLHKRQVKPTVEQIAAAYVIMADASYYRPNAPGDGLRFCDLDESQLEDRELLQAEALDYARQFLEEENSHCFHIGVSDYRTVRAFVLVIEAARVLCAGKEHDDLAVQLLQNAIGEIQFLDRRA